VPFHIIFDKHLENLAPYRVIVLPDSECLSDSQIAAIRQFVESGGGLVVVGASGLYDQWRRALVTPGLAGLVDTQPAAHAYQEHVEQHGEEEQQVRKQVGRGRVVYLSSLRFDGPLPEFKAYFTIDNRYWKNPTNARQFLEGVSWAGNDEPSVHVQGPKYLIANAIEQPSRQFTAVHLVNYNAHQGPAGNVLVTCRHPQNARITAARLYTPDLAEQMELELNTSGAVTAFDVPQIKTYAIVMAKWT
jgi:hypothetical protein